ncbi:MULTISPECIES: response regulator [Oceanobacillus]|uniref:Response regulator n=1 Tax=Oceanobacillus aidingensis TaxID=645964 RepID=A0ABV9JZD9_9BACI|nr:response regulator [Oceanobacillus oncorhynchi]MDM8098555.1 response regulator [Oceanobacillus oncorhynchi]UUI39013.1 response regulator [Oceanobacillus oncorhynchi]
MIRIAIIEDEPLIAKFHQKYIEKIDGFCCTGSVETVEEGIELARRPDVDLILLDIYLQQKNGLDVLKQIRSEEINVDVILITSANDQQSLQTGYRYGVVDYLLKPFTFERFQASLLRYQQTIRVTEGKVHQSEVDRLFHPHEQPVVLKPEDLPKGITKETCRNILTVMMEHEDWLSAADLSAHANISHVSLRKYLRFFEEKRLLEKNVIYHSFGRPLQQYRLSQTGKNNFRHF